MAPLLIQVRNLFYLNNYFVNVLIIKILNRIKWGDTLAREYRTINKIAVSLIVVFARLSQKIAD